MSAIVTFERAMESATRNLREVAAAAIYDEKDAWEQAILTRASVFRSQATFLRQNCGHLDGVEAKAKADEFAADALDALIARVNMQRGDRGGLLPKDGQ